MKINGKSTIDAPQDQVWAALNDIEVLARIVPGCERLDQVGDNEYEGTVKIGIQSIKGTYSGKIRIEDIQPPRHYRLVAAGRSANGVVDGAGTVDLEEQDGQTILTYTGDAQIGGTLASVGQRLIEGASKQLINQSLKALVEQIKLRSAPAPEPVAPAPEPEPTPTPAPEPAHTALDAEAAQAQPPSPPEPPTAEAPTPPSPPTPPAAPSFERRTVVVPDHEQLRPESVVRGIVEDALTERPWIPWVVVAFLLGILIGRSRR